ncbi:hypothetical protein ACHAXT_012686 [Thalassiosira profunda]
MLGQKLRNTSFSDEEAPMSSRAFSFRMCTVIGVVLVAVPAVCLIPGFIARLTIGVLSDAKALRDGDAADMM